MITKPTIVIADDEAHITHILRLKLGNLGYDVHVASDGQEALAMVREVMPDLVVTDLNMPRLTGLDVAKAMKEDPATAAVPIIMLTARSHTLTEEERTTTHIVATMDKPFSVKAIAAMIAELLAIKPGAARAG